jgi:hypothetical protein
VRLLALIWGDVFGGDLESSLRLTETAGYSACCRHTLPGFPTQFQSFIADGSWEKYHEHQPNQRY